MSKMRLCLFGATLAMLCTPAIVAPSTASATSIGLIAEGIGAESGNRVILVGSVSGCRRIEQVCLRTREGRPDRIEFCQRNFEHCLGAPVRTG